MNKKIVSFILILSMFVSLLSFTSFAQGSRLDALKAIGVATGNEAASGDTVTRSSFISMAVRMSGINIASFSGSSADFPFTDVSENDMDYPYIRAAWEMGLINGNGNGFFNGTDSISASQASKILVTLLGYKEKAEALGGYPYGYITVARQKDMFKNITLTNTDEPLHMDAAYELIMNALESSFSEIDSIGTGGTEYRDSVKMYMSQMLDIYKITGVVEQNEYTSLYGRSSLDNNEIEIGGITFNTADTKASELIGYYVNCYFKEIKGSNQIIYIEIDELNNKTINLTSRDIDSGSTSVSELGYSMDNKDLKAKISPDATLIKNGKMTSLSGSAMCPANGEVTLISNDNDNNYDVIIVYDYRTAVVKTVSKMPGSITDSLGGSLITLDSQSDDYTFSIELDGEMLELSELAENDVVAYYEIAGDTVVKKLKVSRSKVSGVIDEINAAEKTITIDGNSYFVTNTMISKLLSGDMGDFYMDIFGTIVYYDLTDDYSVYGFVSQIGKTQGLDAKVKMRIFTEKDRWVELVVQDKIKLNGELKTDDDLYAALNGNCNQLISYRVNADALVTAVTTAVICASDADRAQIALENDEFRLSQTITGSSYRQYLASFGNNCSVGSNARIFFVPEDTTKDYEYFIGGKGNLTANRSYSKVLSYNENKSRVSNLFIVYTGEADSADSELFIYKGRGSAVIDGEEVPCIYGSYGVHGETSVYVNDDEVLSNAGAMNKGDIIRFHFNKMGRVSKITKVYDFTDATKKNDTFVKGQIMGSGLFDDNAILSGIVTSVDVENKRFTLDYGTSPDALFGLDVYLKSISVYDISEESFYKISPIDLTEGDRIVVWCRQYQARSMVVFKD